jgi:hypothetical protein
MQFRAVYFLVRRKNIRAPYILPRPALAGRWIAKYLDDAVDPFIRFMCPSTKDRDTAILERVATRRYVQNVRWETLRTKYLIPGAHGEDTLVRGRASQRRADQLHQDSVRGRASLDQRKETDMSLSEEKIEQERLARQAAIKAALGPDGKAQHPAGPTAHPAQPKLYPPLKPWERVTNGRREQYRPLTTSELEAETERHFLRSQFKTDQEHGAKVQAPLREAKREQADTDKRREHERKTRRREYGKERFISLDEARRRNLLSTPADADSWSTPNNPRRFVPRGSMNQRTKTQKMKVTQP